MSAILNFFGDPWVQLIAWIPAAIMISLFRNYMKGSGSTWNWLSAGVLVYGIRIGYKLFPFYKTNEYTEAGRYVLGIVGLVLIFVGIHKYYFNNVKPLLEMM